MFTTFFEILSSFILPLSWSSFCAAKKSHCFCKVPYQIKFSSIFSLNPHKNVINSFFSSDHDF
jgi:hypothetical protein